MQTKLIEVPFYHQSNNLNCAPASARAVLEFYGIKKTEEELAKLMETDKNKGTSPPNFISGLKTLGLRVQFIHKEPKEKEFKQLQEFLKNRIPIIVSLNLNVYRKRINNIENPVSWQGEDFTFHYVVVTGIDKSFVYINDNADENEKKGKRKLAIKTFFEAWYNKWLFGDIFIIQP